MRFPHFRVVLAVTLACMFSVHPVWADIYKWVDEDGTVTFSNSPPKDGGRVIDVFRSTPWNQASAPIPPEAVAAQQAMEMRALNENLARLTRELEDQRRGAAQSVTYGSYPPPPPMYGGGWGGWNDWNGWNGDGFGSPFFGSPFFPSAVVVVGGGFAPRFNHQFHNFHHGHSGFVRANPNFVPRAGGFSHISAPRAGVRMR